MFGLFWGFWGLAFYAPPPNPTPSPKAWKAGQKAWEAGQEARGRKGGKGGTNAKRSILGVWRLGVWGLGA